jgi:hypothetical protein
MNRHNLALTAARAAPRGVLAIGAVMSVVGLAHASTTAGAGVVPSVAGPVIQRTASGAIVLPRVGGRRPATGVVRAEATVATPRPVGANRVTPASVTRAGGAFGLFGSPVVVRSEQVLRAIGTSAGRRLSYTIIGPPRPLGGPNPFVPTRPATNAAAAQSQQKPGATSAR